MGIRSMARPRRRWLDSVNERLKKKKFGCSARKEHDRNEWKTIGDKVKNDITCTLVVPGENYNGRRVVDFRIEKVLRVCDKYFKYKYICK